MELKPWNSKVAAVWLLVAWGPSLVAQQPDLRTTTRLVVVDVTVSAKNGQPVHGLTCADFQLEESHVRQPLQRCEEHRFGTQEPALPKAQDLPVNVFTNRTATPLPPTLDIVLIDLLNSEPETWGALKQAARDLTRTVAPGHRMAVLALGQQLTLLSGFTDDLHRLEFAQAKMKPGTLNLRANQQANELAAGFTSSPFTSPASVSPASEALIGMLAGRVLADRVEYTLTALRQINRYVSGLPGRKKLLWITSSIPIFFQPHEEDYQGKVEEVSRELGTNRIAIFPIDVRGVRNLSMATASQDAAGIANYPRMFQDKAFAARSTELSEQATMNMMADETGGHAFYGSNDIQKMVRQALETGTDYYTLSYRPFGTGEDIGFRRFHIATPMQEAKLTYRRGYFAESQTTPAATGASEASGAPPSGEERGMYAMQRGLPDSTAILFFAGLHRMGAPVAAVRSHKRKLLEQQYGIDYSINPADLVWTITSEGRTADVTLLLAAYDGQGGTLGEATHTFSLKMNEAQYNEALRKGVHVQESVLLPAGKEAHLRLGVLDRGSDREGTLEIDTGMIRAEAPNDSKK